MVSAILLAAGQSKRMGQPKQLMPFGKSTIFGQTVDNLLGSTVNEIIVVLGYRAQEMSKILATRPVKIALNPDYKQGMSTSVVAGLKLVNSQAQVVLLALADQPLIDTQTINKLIEEYRKNDMGIIVPTYQGRRGHPIIFSIKYKDKLMNLKGDVGGKQIVEEHPQDVLEVPVDSEAIIIDINTLSDYHSLLP